MPRSKKVRNIFFLLLAAICPCLMAQGSRNLEERAATVISLNSSVIDTSLPEPLLPKALRARPAEPGEGEIVLVKFPRPVTARQVQALRAASLRVYTYLPYYAYLVKLPAGAATKSLLTSLGASWSGPFHPAYKISRDIAAVEPGETGAAVKAQDYRPVMIHILPDAALSDVFWIELESRKTLLNDTTIWVGQSGLSGGQTTPIFSQGIFGEGQTVAIIDTGIDPDMCFFRDTALGLPPTNVCNGGTMVSTAQRKVLAVDFLATSECNGGIAGNEWDTHGHGTHVAGTVAGDNFANLLTHDTADGMAPGAKLVIQDAGFLTDNCADLPGLGCPVVDLD